MRIAIVTGASSGLGIEFARLLDREENIDCIWLIARRKDRLLGLAQSLSTASEVIPLDLVGPNAMSALTARLSDQDEVVWLINNAGIGLLGPFSDHSVDDHRRQIRLNSEVPLALIGSLHPFFIRGSRIINVASVAGFLPQPGLASYAGTKAMLISFSRALREEYKARGITVTASCPNPMDTEFFMHSEKGGQESAGIKKIGFESPDGVAAAAIDKAKKGKPLSVTHPFAKVIRLAAKLLPLSLLFFFMRLVGIGGEAD